MNAKSAFLGLLLVGSSAVLLSSCEKKDVYDPSKATKTTDLTPAAGFDWAMTRDVTINLQSKNGTHASFYLDNGCKELVAELNVQPGNSSTVLSLPTINSKIWVKYPVASGEEVKEIAVLPATRAGGAGSWTANSLFPDYAENSSNTRDCKYQPKKDVFGTIMFEDMWPSLGDYDFNDYVVNYNVTTESRMAQNDWDHIYVTLRLKIRAIGGSYPYRFCVRVGSKSNSAAMDLRRNEVEITDVEIKNNSVDGKVEMLENTQYAVFALTGFDKLKTTTGGGFYNTQQAHLIENSKTPEVTIKFTVTRKGNANKVFDSFGSEYAFDYFLQHTENNREIHFIDYPPTDMYTTYDADKGSNATTYYCSDKQFVWALKAPIEMGWCVETKDIVNVYPKFAEWVIKGGDRIVDENNWDSNYVWYVQPKNNNDYISPKDH